MPIDSHVLHIVSRSIILSAPKYKTGLRSRAAATFNNFEIGDFFCLPVANQNSSSHTQKSSSMCDAIACLSVMIMSSIISYCLPVESRYSDMGFDGVLSNVMSVNVGVGISVKSGAEKFESDSGAGISKSVGNGISSSSGSIGVVSDEMLFGVCGWVG